MTTLAEAERTDTNQPMIPRSRIPAVNVSQVPKRSPLRYPRGKTWLIPHIREWLGKEQPTKPRVLVEPFAGGATATLTAVAEGLVDTAVIAEIDPDVNALWQAALHQNQELRERVLEFQVSEESVREIEEEEPETTLDRGFRTLVLNRTRRGGILADGASTHRVGENGKGIKSRWYPETLVNRLTDIGGYADRITMYPGDGMELLKKLSELHGKEVVMFIDPPYTAGGKNAGDRLYRYSEINHKLLFSVLGRTETDFLMTYDNSEKVLDLVSNHGFQAAQVAMKNTHHQPRRELVITRRSVFAGRQAS